MNIQENMCNWELQKAGYLMQIAGKLGMDLTGYGHLAVNSNSGNTYLWLEDYAFCLYMPISCDLKPDDIWVSWSNPNNGEEFEESLTAITTNFNISDIEDWVKQQAEGVAS